MDINRRIRSSYLIRMHTQHKTKLTYHIVDNDCHLEPIGIVALIVQAEDAFEQSSFTYFRRRHQLDGKETLKKSQKNDDSPHLRQESQKAKLLSANEKNDNGGQ